MGIIEKKRVGRPWKNIDRDKEILCACGCGQKRKRYDNKGRERKYLYHHQGSTISFKEIKHPGHPRREKHYMWKGGMPKCLNCKKELSRYNSSRCRSCNLKVPGRLREIALKNLLIGLGKQQNHKEPTSIEKKLYDELKARGLLFETQKLINGKFWVDAYIPHLNLIIEADGGYWHSLDKVVKRDRSKDIYLTKCGFNILRLSEAEINNGTFKERMVT